MDIVLAAAQLDAAYTRFMELEAEFYRQQREHYIVAAEVTSARKRAGKALMKAANIYSSLSGEVFDWPRDAVFHARDNFLPVA
jgi:hypothetical protein